jgi:pyruvate/2-oxoglutarate dehydrogenase complex dihydrolipoamide acyltransferase (E2) component
MNINDILSETGDTAAVREALVSIGTSLRVAAHDYAHAALGASTEALGVVQASGPVAAVIPHVLEHQKYNQRSYAALNAAISATNLLLMAEQTGDDEIDHANSGVKFDAVQPDVVFALLEGAHNRMALVNSGIPKTPSPGSRCIPQNGLRGEPS